ncbi:hypothetical protein [Lentzea flaviverrucosa]|uniref:Uncharacterized protein n=1 Tax=Lentzea flaviverrucosa TaxID=200379 RepID=A0A1H9WRL1_9PSEU|nr:hypothetical protein [Lentzea flaviverrucosa]RDI23037.1 hypothetical protein DFR72_111168 [Lentzea flaviverrucosa]SES36548.1 hypothetical protein SAMN05216195_112163 [Lentzea flaviverrucosa]
MSNTIPSTVVLTPLHHEPRRIRPPFNVESQQPDDHRPGETNDDWRARNRADQVAALLEALDGIELGAHDHRIVEWLAGWDTSVIGTVASLFYRARAVDGDR